jgi:hypothetical protein
MIENKPISQGSPQGKTVDDYKGEQKWCFAIVLNRACDNYEENHKLFSESLLEFEKTHRKDWLDEETRKLIHNVEEILPPDPQKKYEIKPKNLANIRLNEVRNYFSHFHHKDWCLYFKADDPIRIIMEKAYDKAKEKVIGHLKKEPEIKIPESLFESNGRITPAGIIFLASFFVERRFLSRLMGYVGGFKESEGEYSITRDIFSTYCLKDSYSIHTPDSKAMLFRDILGYLSLVPSEYYPTYLSQIPKRKPDEKLPKDEKYGERKPDKFILFALKYLEEIVSKGLADTYKVSVARMEIIREETKEAEKSDEQYKPRPNEGTVKIVFESKSKPDGEELPYYINHNTVILRIQKKGDKIHFCKMGVNELKYFILLCLQGKTAEAVAAVDNYIHSLQSRFANPAETVRSDEAGIPEFILRQSGKVQDKDKEKAARIKYIRDKWEKKKAESAEMELHRKGRDILRYVNWNSKQPLGTNKYNLLLELLVKKDFDGFGKQLFNLKLKEHISDEVFKRLTAFKTINTLHEKVCSFVLEELTFLEQNEPAKLEEYIGLVRKPAPENNPPPEYKDKVKAFVEQPMIYKGFLRENVFKENKKTFAKLVEETLGRLKYPDVPLGKDFYYVVDPKLSEKENRFQKDNKILYETLALDRLCAMMARICYENINENLRKSGQEIIWKKENDKEFLYLSINPAKLTTATLREPKTSRTAFGDNLKIPLPSGTQNTFTIRFDRKDYTKLYVMDDAEFLGGLVLHFFSKEKEPIDYHRLYSEGINYYTELQRQGIMAILKMEEKIVMNKKIPMTGNYIGFKTIMKESGYPPLEQNTLNKVRNALLHYHLKFEPTDYNKVVEIMKREGLESKNKIRKTDKK